MFIYIASNPHDVVDLTMYLQQTSKLCGRHLANIMVWLDAADIQIFGVAAPAPAMATVLVHSHL